MWPKNKTLVEDEQKRLMTVYPPEPGVGRRGCRSNVTYDTPKNSRMRQTILGPTSLKKNYMKDRDIILPILY